MGGFLGIHFEQPNSYYGPLLYQFYIRKKRFRQSRTGVATDCICVFGVVGELHVSCMVIHFFMYSYNR